MKKYFIAKESCEVENGLPVFTKNYGFNIEESFDVLDDAKKFFDKIVVDDVSDVYYLGIDSDGFEFINSKDYFSKYGIDSNDDDKIRKFVIDYDLDNLQIAYERIGRDFVNWKKDVAAGLVEVEQDYECKYGTTLYTINKQEVIVD